MRLSYFAALSAAILGIAAVAEAHDGGGSLVPNKTVDITFTGYCDGMHLVINQVTGLVTGNRTGSCVPSTPIFGTVGANAKSGAGVTVTLNAGGTSFIYVIDSTPRTWANYTLELPALNGGSYTVGVGVAASKLGRQTTQR